jgi:hypothetical protein
MPQENPIYTFLKENNLTDKDPQTFSKEYSDPKKAEQIHQFFVENKLTDKDSASFYDTYLKPSSGTIQPTAISKEQQKKELGERITSAVQASKPKLNLGESQPDLITMPTKIEKDFEVKKKTDAENNTITKRLSQKGLPTTPKNISTEKSLLKKDVDNGDVKIMKDDKGNFTYGRVPSIGEAATKAVYDNVANLVDLVDLGVTSVMHPEKKLDKIKEIKQRKQFEEQIKFSPTSIEIEPEKHAAYGLGGQLAYMATSLAPDIAMNAATGGLGKFAKGAAMVGYFELKDQANKELELYDNKVEQLTKQGVPQAEAEKQATEHLGRNAAIANFPNSMLMAYLFHDPEQLKIPAVKDFSKSLGEKSFDVAKMAAMAGVQEAATQGIQTMQGYTPEKEKIGENVKQFSVMDAFMKSVGLLGELPSYMKAYTKEMAVQPEVKPFVYLALKDNPNADNIKAEIDNYAAVTEPVRKVIPPDEMNGGIGGRVELIAKLEQGKKDLEEQKKQLPKSVHDNIDEAINNIQSRIDKANEDITTIQKTGEPLDVEHDNLTGEPVMPKEEVKDVEVPTAPKEEIFYTGRGKKYEDLKTTQGDYIFFSKDPEISAWYGGHEGNVTSAKLDTSEFLDLTTQEKKSEFVRNNFTDEDVLELYPQLERRAYDEAYRDKRMTYEGRRRELIDEYKERLLNNRFSADGKEQNYLLDKIKEKGYKGVKLLDDFLYKEDISHVVIDKSVIETLPSKEPKEVESAVKSEGVAETTTQEAKVSTKLGEEESTTITPKALDNEAHTITKEYGYSAKQDEKGNFTITNRLGKEVATVKKVKNRYQIFDSAGNKLGSDPNLEKGIRDLIEKHFATSKDSKPDKSYVSKAIKEGLYEKAISEGRMTAEDAKSIIESAGLEVPKGIEEMLGGKVIKATTEEKPALKDVESTAKALEELSNTKDRQKSDAYFELNDYTKGKNGFGLPVDENYNKKLSEAYHKAKADGSNPELVKAVEDLLGKEKPQPLEALTQSIEDVINGKLEDIEGHTEQEVESILNDIYEERQKKPEYIKTTDGGRNIIETKDVEKNFPTFYKRVISKFSNVAWDSNDIRDAISYLISKKPVYKAGMQDLIESLIESEKLLKELGQDADYVTKDELLKKIDKNEDYTKSQKDIFKNIVNRLKGEKFFDFTNKNVDAHNGYVFSDNLLKAKDADAFIHEVGHWGFYNLLSSEDRIKYLEYVRDNFYGTNKNISDDLAFTRNTKLKDKVLSTNSEDNFSEYFAEQFRQYVIDGLAPKEIKSIFSRFKEYLTDIIKLFKEKSYNKELKPYFDKIISEKIDNLKTENDIYEERGSGETKGADEGREKGVSEEVSAAKDIEDARAELEKRGEYKFDTERIKRADETEEEYIQRKHCQTL